MRKIEDEAKLEKLKIVALAHLTSELWEECIALNEPAIHTMVGMFKDSITVRLTCNFFGRKEGEYIFEWYSSWWQELRSKILPEWYLNKFPSIMEIKKIVQAVSVYPSLKIADYENQAVIVFKEIR